MKHSIALSLLALTTTVNAQIKVFSGGLQSYGSTTSPASGLKHQFTGNLGVSESGSTSSGCALIKANGTTNPSSASRPDYTWLGDDNAGIYHLSADVFGFATNGLERMRVDNVGNVSIGTTTNYTARLAASNANYPAFSATATYTADNGYCQINYVNRDNTKAFAIHNNASGSYVETIVLKGNGIAWGQNGVWYSDRNLKENFDTLKSSLSIVKQLKGMKYNFKANVFGDGPPETEIGLIAQDVEQILPEVVETNETGIKGIKYTSIIPVLIEAIKELDAKNTKLENDLNTCCSKADTRSGRTINLGNGINNNNSESSYLLQNKPNPFNKETSIEYNVIEQGSAAILVFDMNGKLLRTIPVKIPGKGNISISANDFAPGMYYYTLIVNDKEIDTKKMILTQ